MSNNRLLSECVKAFRGQGRNEILTASFALLSFMFGPEASPRSPLTGHPAGDGDW